MLCSFNMIYKCNVSFIPKYHLIIKIDARVCRGMHSLSEAVVVLCLGHVTKYPNMGCAFFCIWQSLPYMGVPATSKIRCVAKERKEERKK